MPRKASKPSDPDPLPPDPVPASLALWAPISPQPPAAFVPPPVFTRAPDLVIPADAQVHPVAVCRWCKGQFRRIHQAHWICCTEACAERQLAHAIERNTVAEGDSPYLYVPLPLQVDIDESPVRHLLVAGAAGTAKSTSARWGLYKRCRDVDGYRALILRATFPELEKNHLQFMTRESQLLGDARYVGFQAREMRFSNGAVIYGGSCDDERALSRHIGAEWDEIQLDEAVTFMPKALNEIVPRARGSEPARVAMEALGLTPRSRCVSNPGGRAMLYLIDHYIRRAPDPEEYPTYQAENYGYIGAMLEDNPFLSPTYEKTELSGLSRARYKQLRFGDWTAFAGLFFDQLDESIHVTTDPYRGVSL